jgi:hypothetical protein
MNERGLMRDYAREEVMPDLQDGGYVIAMRGEVAGKAFIALQGVLEEIEHSEKVNEFGSPCVNTGLLRQKIRKAFE